MNFGVTEDADASTLFVDLGGTAGVTMEECGDVWQHRECAGIGICWDHCAEVEGE